MPQTPTARPMHLLSNWLVNYEDAAEKLAEDQRFRKMLIRFIDWRMGQLARCLKHRSDEAEPDIEDFVGRYVSQAIDGDDFYGEVLLYSTLLIVRRLNHDATSEFDLLMFWRRRLDSATPDYDRWADEKYEVWLIDNVGYSYVNRLRDKFPKV